MEKKLLLIMNYNFAITLLEISMPPFVLTRSYRQNFRPVIHSASCYTTRVREVDSFSSY